MTRRFVVTDCEVPPGAILGEGQEKILAFTVHDEEEPERLVRVLYALEAFGDQGEVGVHVSISVEDRGVIVKIRPRDLHLTLEGIKAKGLRFPETGKWEATMMQGGRAAGRGVHVWELF